MKYLLFIAILLIALFYAADAQAGVIFKPVFHTGLVGYWDFQEGAGSIANDHSGYDNHGTLENMATSSNGGWTDGKLGSALDFDGIDDYVSVSNDATLNAGAADSITYGGWIYPRTINDSTGDRIIAKREGSAAAYAGYDVSARNSFFQAEISDSDPEYEVAKSITADQWYHVMTVVSRADNLATLYVNGSVEETVDITGLGDMSNAQPLIFGWNGGLQTGTQFDGKIDEVRIYNRALSAGEVERLYKLSQPKIAAPTMTGLVGYWAFEEGKGTKARDSSFNTNHGDLQNMEENDWVDGKLGTALDFDGSDEYVNCGSDSSLDDLPAFTYSLWIYPTGWGEDNEGALIHKESSEKELRLMNGSGEESLRMYIRGGGGGNTAETNASNGSISLNEWQHIVMTFDLNGDAKARLYKNGVELNYALQLAGAAPLEPDADGNLLIGKGYSTIRRFDGIIDEVRIYNRALETSEIEALYKSGLAKINASQNDKITDGLVGLWSFNGPDMDGDDAFDRSGEGNHGTLQNGPVPAIGKVGQALEFDGTDDYVELTDSSFLNDLSQVTLTLWMKPDTLDAGWNSMAFRWSSAEGTQESFAAYAKPGGIGIEYATNADENSYKSITTLPDFTGQWSHYGAILDFENDVWRLYQNGAEVASDTLVTTGTGLQNNAYIFTIGAGYRTSPIHEFDGIIDEVRVYNRALSAQEIQRLYNLGR